MRVAFFDTHKFERPVFETFNQSFHHEISFFDSRLDEETAILAKGYDAVCSFVNDRVNEKVLKFLSRAGVQVIALRSAGFNHVDLPAAQSLGIRVLRVPAYSPYAVAEHAMALILGLNRKLCKASARVHELNFSLDGLVGFDLNQKTVGIIGTGRIGLVMIKILKGFGCRVLGFDQTINLEAQKKLDFEYVSLDEIYHQSDIVSLHVPLTKLTRHLLDQRAFTKMKKGVMLINTGRGALVDTKALIQALKTGHVGAAGLDVYEEEENIFFHDLSEGVLQDDTLARLMTFPNVLITAHQAFLTHEALGNIAETTLKNLDDFQNNRPLLNEVRV